MASSRNQAQTSRKDLRSLTAGPVHGETRSPVRGLDPLEFCDMKVCSVTLRRQEAGSRRFYGLPCCSLRFESELWSHCGRGTEELWAPLSSELQSIIHWRWQSINFLFGHVSSCAGLVFQSTLLFLIKYFAGFTLHWESTLTKRENVVVCQLRPQILQPFFW